MRVESSSVRERLLLFVPGETLRLAEEGLAHGRIENLNAIERAHRLLVEADWRAEGKRIHARLELSEWLENAQIRGQCACGQRIPCEHLVAVVMLLENESAATDPEPQAAEAKPMSPALKAWIANQKQPMPDGLPDDGRAPLVFLWAMEETSLPGSDLVIEPARLDAHPSKPGADGSRPAPVLSRFNPAEAKVEDLPEHEFNWVSQLALARTVIRRAEQWYVATKLRPADSIWQMLEQSHCYWERLSPKRLHRGDGCTLVWSWQIDEFGVQRLGAQVPGVERMRLVRASLGFIVVDVGRAEVRMVDGDVAEITRLLETPSIAPDELDAFLDAFADTDLARVVPAPRSLRIERAQDLEPEAVLRLVGVPVPGWAQAKLGQKLGMAVLEFNYGPHRVEPGFGVETERYRDGVLYRIERNYALEEAAAERVLEAGLKDAITIWPRQLPEPESFGDFHYLLELNYHIATPEQWVSVIPRLEESSFQLEYDPSFPNQVLPLAEDWWAEVDHSEAAWFDIKIGVTINQERIDLLPALKRLAVDPQFPRKARDREPAEAEYLVPIDAHRRVRMPLGRLRHLLDTLRASLVEDEDEGELRLHRSEINNLKELVDSDEIGLRLDPKRRAQLRDLSMTRKPVSPPAHFGAELRAYQNDGLNWLGFLGEAGIGGILADDMGLGKTVQVLAHLAVEKQAGRLTKPVLIVVPTSLLGNWFREAQRLAPELSVLILHGPDRESGFRRIKQFDLVLSSYPLLPRDIDHLQREKFGLLVLDEAQAIKNPRSLAAKAARDLKVTRRLAMTGTPLENHLGELWAILDAVEPGVLGSERHFLKHYRQPIEKFGDADQQERLNRRVAPLILRRRKEDVARDLPAKTTQVQTITLDGEQKALYESLRAREYMRVREAVGTKGMGQSGVVVLDALLKLRQVCCDPRLVKLEAAQSVHDSAKLEHLADMLEQLVQEGRRVLVFSQFAEMLALISELLTGMELSHLLLTGQTQNRTELVDRFQLGDTPIFLISLKAGGVGLNLTAADTVIHYDPWWNPAAEDQATDRAHRIGQDKPVFVYKLICAGTVEERIQTLQARKAELAAALLEGGTSTAIRFDEEDLEELFGPG